MGAEEIRRVRHLMFELDVLWKAIAPPDRGRLQILLEPQNVKIKQHQVYREHKISHFKLCCVDWTLLPPEVPAPPVPAQGLAGLWGERGWRALCPHGAGVRHGPAPGQGRVESRAAAAELKGDGVKRKTTDLGFRHQRTVTTWGHLRVDGL